MPFTFSITVIFLTAHWYSIVHSSKDTFGVVAYSMQFADSGFRVSDHSETICSTLNMNFPTGRRSHIVCSALMTLFVDFKPLLLDGCLFTAPKNISRSQDELPSIFLETPELPSRTKISVQILFPHAKKFGWENSNFHESFMCFSFKYPGAVVFSHLLLFLILFLCTN